MKRLIGAAVIVLLGTGWALAVDTRVTLPPDLAPLKARLVVKQDTYTLDPAQKGAEFRKKLRELPAQNGPRGIRIQPGQIQIRAVPAPAPGPAPVPMPGGKGGQGFRRVPVQPAPPDAGKPAPADEKKEPKAQEADGQKKQDGKDKGDKEKKDKEDAQEFKIQAQGGQIQIQGRIQVQGGVPGGPPQVRVLVFGGPQRPLPPEVDLELELTNASDREMTLLVGSGRSQLDLKLDGPGAVTLPSGGPAQVQRRSEVKLAPGAVHKIPVKRLQHGRLGRAASYWTEPGEYTLTATYKSQLKAASDADKDKPIEVTAPPVKLKVVEGK